MLRKMCALTLLTTGILSAGNAMAADKLIVSTWGGSFKDLIDQTIAKEFTKETGVEVQFVTGGTIDRLNKAKLAGGSPETDVTFHHRARRLSVCQQRPVREARHEQNS